MVNTLKKSFVGVLAATVMFAAFAMPAKAQTVAELQALINQLMSQIAAMQGGSATTNAGASCTYTHSGPTMRVGSRGTQVMAMQNALNASGFSVGTADGVFGNMTANGVRAFQAAKGLTADGLFGNASGAALANHCATSVSTNPGTTTPSTPGSLSGQDADVKSVDVRFEDDAEVGMRDQKVASIEVELDRNSGDIAINRFDIEFTVTASSGENRLFRILEAVTLEVDGREVGSTRTSSRTDWLNINSGSTEGTVRLSGLNIVAKGDAVTTIDVLVDVSRLSDSDVSGLTLGLEVLGWRYTEATGAISSDVENSWDLDTSFSIETEDTADLRLRSASNNPESTIIKGEDDTETRGVTVNTFTLESRDVDSYIETITIELDVAVSPSATSVVRRAELWRGNTRVDVRTVTGDEVEFDLRDYQLRSNRSEEFSVRLDLNRIATPVVNNSTIQVDVVDVAGYDANDRAISSSGTAAGNVHTYSLATADITFGSNPWTVNNVGTIIDFTFSVDATDEDFEFSIPSSTITGNVPGVTSTTPTLTRVGGTTSDATVATTTATVFSGRQATFRLRYAATATSGNNGQFWEVKITEVGGQAVPSNRQTSPSATVNLQ